MTRFGTVTQQSPISHICHSGMSMDRTPGNTPKGKILWWTKMFKIDPLCRILLWTGMVIWAQRLDTRFIWMCPVNSHVGYPWYTILEPKQTSLPYYPETPMSLCLESHDKFGTWECDWFRTHQVHGQQIKPHC